MLDTTRLADSIAGANGAAAHLEVADLKARFRAGKSALLQLYGTGGASPLSASLLVRGLAGEVDRTLHDLWLRSGLPSSAALVAVGGYGRGELFPYSDIDVLVLLPPADAQCVRPIGADALKTSIEGFITACWDVGLEIGSSVRTVEECIAEGRRDVTIQTALLEARLICGSRRVFRTFRRANADAMDPKAFLRAKTVEMRQRHQKYEDTPYSLEPNCKESPGGLRDLQTVMWVARAAGLGRTWGELAAKGLITAFEVKQLQRNEGLMKAIRARLHIVAGRREDRLVFDLQTPVAESFGYVNTRDQRASEQLMRRYYWAAKAVTQLNLILMLNIEERVNGSEHAPMRPINAHFLDRARMLEVASDEVYTENTHAILETFYVYQTTP
ncbi:MAG: bifunctional uridylyltransferase/uridylyl-removing protein, partial [Rhizobacter sp.]|nr:bifunctional uridylyltransferase/uridylyl-removing protein [Rhizobacter sp.]